jgi:hypothetical protein
MARLAYIRCLHWKCYFEESTWVPMAYSPTGTPVRVIHPPF